MALDSDKGISRQQVESSAATCAIDQATLMKLKEDVGDGFDDLIPIFIESAIKIIDSLEQAYREEDIEAFLRYAHSLKSSSAYLGGLHLSNVAARLEHHAKHAKLPDSDDFIDGLRQEFARIEAGLS